MPKPFYRLPFILANSCLTVASSAALADIKLDYSSNLRYRYEIFERDQDAVTPPDASSKASTLRLGLAAKATLGAGFGAYVDTETVAQVGEDDYNIPTIPAQAIPGYPVISDPQGAEINQAFGSYSADGGKLVAKLGRQEVVLNNGRFISNSAWRQNHQSFNGFTAAYSPSPALKLDYGYLSRVLRVSGDESSNGRTDMASHFVNGGYTLKDVGIFKAYAVLLDFDTELTNSVDTYGLRFEGNSPLGSLRLLSTLEYASQSDAGDNPNSVDAAYILADLGVQVKDIAFRGAYNLLEGTSVQDKFITPLAHPHNGWSEFFLTNPSLGSSHGLEVLSLSAIGKIPGVPNLSFTSIYYDYSPDTGDASYGSEIDLGLEYKASAKAIVGWRLAAYKSDGLFSDALRTSVYAGYTF